MLLRCLTEKYLISDHANNAVRQIDTKSGIITTYAGGKAGFAGDSQTADKAKFKMVMSVSFDPQKEQPYIADIRNFRIRMIDLKTNKVSTAAGTGRKGGKDGSALEAQLNGPKTL